MKNLTVFSSVALVMLAVASTAHAQSRITLYGELDNAIAYYNNTGHASLVEALIAS